MDFLKYYAVKNKWFKSSKTSSPFDQADILHNLDAEYRQGICFGLCLEYSRFLLKTRKEDKKVNSLDFLGKLKRKFISWGLLGQVQQALGFSKGAEHKNLKKRLQTYQHLQRTLQYYYEDTEYTNNKNIDFVKYKSSPNAKVTGLVLHFQNSAHIICFAEFINPKGIKTYSVFDPNFGIVEFEDYKECNTCLNEIIGFYNSQEEIKSIISNDFTSLVSSKHLAPTIETGAPIPPEYKALKYAKEYELDNVIGRNLENHKFWEISRLLRGQNDPAVNKLYDGKSLLHEAIAFAQPVTILKKFISSGANVNITNSDLETPLHTALRMEAPDKEVVKLLIENGADIYAADSKGVTPIDLAKKNEINLREILHNTPISS
ncbi:MAG: ankyrin repeat domain-containing protein, partial [Rickettsiaceae bacterium]|nr:ankyrin repeat domain-containing protein [Rickettsiaceae bacterium]